MNHIVITLSAENAFGLADQLRALADRFDRVGDVALPAPGTEKGFMFEGKLVGTFARPEAHLIHNISPAIKPVPNPGAKLTGLLRTMREEAADAEEKGHEIMPSALTHYAHLFEEALAAGQMQLEWSHG